jgi:hypothetical protein
MGGRNREVWAVCGITNAYTERVVVRSTREICPVVTGIINDAAVQLAKLHWHKTLQHESELILLEEHEA